MFYKLLLLFFSSEISKGIYKYTCDMQFKIFISINSFTQIGYYHHHQERIIGGNIQSITNYPYQISLRAYGKHFCGGAIIKKDTIITAAHCLKNINYSSEALTIQLGSTNLNNNGEIIPVAAVIPHPLFNPFNDDNDIAVVFLEKPLQYSNKVQPVKLPKADLQIIENTTAIVSGWGSRLRVNNYNDLSNILLAAKVKVYSRKRCLEDYPYDAITESMMCAGADDGSVDSCQGDSGGPLITADNGILIGIVSWGYSCGLPHLPGVYTNVAVMRRFIQFVVNT